MTFICHPELVSGSCSPQAPIAPHVWYGLRALCQAHRLPPSHSTHLMRSPSLAKRSRAKLARFAFCSCGYLAPVRSIILRRHRSARALLTASPYRTSCLVRFTCSVPSSPLATFALHTPYALTFAC